MKRNIEQYMDCLEKRLGTLRLVAEELKDAREAFTKLDLDAIYEHIDRQQGFCAEMRSLDRELRLLEKKLAVEFELESAGAGRTLSERLDPASAERLRLLRAALKAVQAEVRRLARVHAALLRRSRYTLNILSNFLGSRTGLYQPPVMASPVGSGK